MLLLLTLLIGITEDDIYQLIAVVVVEKNIKIKIAPSLFEILTGSVK